MRDEERAAIGKIGDMLEELRGRWRDPHRELSEYVRPFEVTSVNARERNMNPALLTRLDELENERRQIHELLMDGQLRGMGPIEALAAKAERLREDFAVLDAQS